MNHTLLIGALLAVAGLTACDRPVVVTPPGPAVNVPGPAGPTGATGATGNQGNQGYQGSVGTPGATGSQGSDGVKGDPGRTGSGSTVIVMPPASAPAN